MVDGKVVVAREVVVVGAGDVVVGAYVVEVVGARVVVVVGAGVVVVVVGGGEHIVSRVDVQDAKNASGRQSLQGIGLIVPLLGQ